MEYIFQFFWAFVLSFYQDNTQFVINYSISFSIEVYKLRANYYDDYDNYDNYCGVEKI